MIISKLFPMQCVYAKNCLTIVVKMHIVLVWKGGVEELCQKES